MKASCHERITAMKRGLMALLLVIAIPQSPLADMVGAAAPGFVMEDIDGKPVSLTSFTGKALILFHFNTYCHSCRLEVPTINTIQQNHADLKVIGIAIGNDRREAETFRRQYKPQFTLVADPGQKIYRDYSVHTVPLVDIIDKTGTIRYRGKIADYADFESAMKQVIAEREEVGPHLWNRAPDFSLKNTLGKQFRLYDIIGEKTVLVTFMSVKDRTVRQIVEIMKTLFARYRREDLEIIRIAVQDTLQEVNDFQHKYHVSFPILLDSDGTVAARYGVANLPRTLIINKKGKIRYSSDQIALDNLIPILTKVKSYFREELPEGELRPYLEKVEPGVTAFDKVTLEDGRNIYIGTSTVGNEKLIVREVFRDVLCDVCTNVHFVYSFDYKGTIRNIVLVESIDLYGEPIDPQEFIQRLIQKANDKLPLKLREDIDALTGATQSCKLILEGINETPDILMMLRKYRDLLAAMPNR